MKTLPKIMIKSFLIYGLAFAGAIAGIDFLMKKETDIWKWVIDFFIFGFFMSLGARYHYKKRNE